jgi:hypothetical protein
MNLKQILIAITARANQEAIGADLGKLALFFGKQRKNIDQTIKGIDDVASTHSKIVNGWATHFEIESALSQDKTAKINRTFDACDLMIYLAVAKAAGVSAIPGEVVLSLTQDELSAVGETIKLDFPRAQRFLAKFANIESAPNAHDDSVIDFEAVHSRIESALDNVPYDYMVRNIRCAASDIKTLAGAGAPIGTEPEVQFDNNFAVGRGWTRNGNRRHINVNDKRILDAIIRGPDLTHFIARPWIKASRYQVAEDPHRHGTQFAGKGAWPCEWRVFIKNNEVIAVSNYYGWTGGATPENALAALAARVAAQQMLKQMIANNIIPQYEDAELARRMNSPAAALIADFDPAKISCTLDFIETNDGMTLLEGGPAHYPLVIAGGHSCAFTGSTGAPSAMTSYVVPGIAFRMLDGVLMGDHETWHNGKDASREGRFLSFEEAETLASEYHNEIDN